MKAIVPSGAGYTVDKGAWRAAAREGLKKRIVERLDIFGRPVDIHTLAERVSDTGNIPYTKDEVLSGLYELQKDGAVEADAEERWYLKG